MMKKYTLFVIILLITTPIVAQRKQQKSLIPADKAPLVRQILYQTENYIKAYPDARFLDIYEYWAEAILGPNKIITDTISMADNIRSIILQANDTMMGPDYEYIGTARKYVRVNVRLIRDHKVPQRAFISAVLDTEYDTPEVNIEKWKEEWWLINQAIKESDIRINTSKFEEDIVAQSLAQEKARPTKSALLANEYHYFYYIVSVKKFREELLPYINGAKSF